MICRLKPTNRRITLIFQTPDKNKLHDFLLGLVSPKEQAEISSYLDSRPEILRELAESLGSNDGLITALRRANLDIFNEPALCQGINNSLATHFHEPQRVDNSQKEFGDYLLEIRLASKNYYSVYQAWDKTKNCRVAIKIANTPGPLNAKEFEIQNEIKILSEIKHENIVSIIEHGLFNDTAFFSMEWLDGSDLACLMNRTGRLPLPECCEIIRQICQGLDFTWKHQIIHRDIKPSNLFLTTNGIIKILDFGSSLHPSNKSPLESGEPPDSLVGTLDYMAPEQVLDGNKVDIRADIYSIGCTFFKLLTGKAPFAFPQYRPLARKLIAHTQAPFPNIQSILPDCPSEISHLLGKMTAKNPADRIGSPSEIAKELIPYCQGADLEMFFSKSPVFTPLPVLEFPEIKKEGKTKSIRRTILSLFAVLVISIPVLFFSNRHFDDASQGIEATAIDLNQPHSFHPNQHGEIAMISFEKVFRGHLWKSIVSKNKRHIYFAVNDGTVRKWDLRENKQVWISGSHRIGKDEPTHALCLSADEEFLLCGGNPNWVECLSALDGRKIWESLNHTKKIWGSGISPDGKYGLTSGEDEFIRFYDMATGREIQFPRNEQIPMFSGGFTSDSSVFYSSSDVLKLWKINGPVLLDKALNPQGLGLIFSFHLAQGSEDFIYSVAEEGTVFCHQVVDHSLVEQYCWHGDQKDLRFSGISAYRDPILGVEKILLIRNPRETQGESPEANNFLLLVRKNEQFAVKEMVGHTDRVTSGHFTPDGKIAITTSLDSTCRFWNVDGD